MCRAVWTPLVLALWEALLSFKNAWSSARVCETHVCVSVSLHACHLYLYSSATCLPVSPVYLCIPTSRKSLPPQYLCVCPYYLHIGVRQSVPCAYQICVNLCTCIYAYIIPRYQLHVYYRFITYSYLSTSSISVSASKSPVSVSSLIMCLYHLQSPVSV